MTIALWSQSEAVRISGVESNIALPHALFVHARIVSYLN